MSLRFFSLLLISLPSFASITLNENVIKRHFDSTPKKALLETIYHSSQVNSSEFDEQFQTTLDANLSYVRNKEKPLDSFIPVTSPIQVGEVSVNKNFKYGFGIKGKIFSEQTTNSRIYRGTTIGTGLEFFIDLNKNLFGSQSRANLDSLSINKEKEKVNLEIQEHALYQTVRKIYWGIVSNNESLEISKTLLKAATKQLINAKKRYADSVADLAEVTKYESLVASRSASITYFEYLRADLIMKLKQFLPSLANEEIVLDKYNLQNTVDKMLVCTAIISKELETPLDNTLYDELAKLIKEEASKQKLLAKTHSMADVNLVGEYSLKGKDFSYSDSFEDFQDDSRNHTALSLNISIPLGSTKKSTSDLKQMIIQKSSIAQADENIAKINSYHSQTKRSIALLNKVLMSQKYNTEMLKRSLELTEKKYKQARVTLRELINEQDLYFSSSLDEISTKSTVIRVVLDYFSVFPNTPCELNLKAN